MFEGVVVQLLAEEIEAKAKTSGFELIHPVDICKVAEALTQGMRADCPWPDLLNLMVHGVVNNQGQILPGRYPT